MTTKRTLPIRAIVLASALSCGSSAFAGVGTCVGDVAAFEVEKTATIYTCIVPEPAEPFLCGAGILTTIWGFYHMVKDCKETKAKHH